jgi:flagellar biosynthesis repressor protein FlbT
MALKITLKPNEKMIVGGAVIRNGLRKCDFVVENNVPILRQNNILTAEQANTPARRIYLAIQLMYIDADQLAKHQQLFWDLVKEFLQAAPSALAIIDHMNELILKGDYYQALKSSQKLMDFEQEVIENATKHLKVLPVD